MSVKIIHNGQVVPNEWELMVLPQDENTPIPDGKVMVPLSVWNDRYEALANRTSTIGLWLNSDEMPDQIQGNFIDLPVIAVNFPEFKDGRGFTLGRLLRERYGYKGELRAIGNPIRDQLHYLSRCGFNAFALADHYDPEAALASLKVFSDAYQSAYDQPKPLFLRRAST